MKVCTERRTPEAERGDLMEMNIGNTIAALRREKKLTQEQLADMLGVSAPAVSKWETGSSYPDITLLCPLARALDTTVDALLQFEPQLSEKEAGQMIAELSKIAKQQGSAAAEAELQTLIHRYPNSAVLKFNAAAFLILLNMLFPLADEEEKQRWREEGKRLIIQVRDSGDAAYWERSVHWLAQLALQEDDTDTAEALLNQLPKQTEETTSTRALLQMKQGMNEEALKTIQKRLYELTHQMLTLFGMMLNEKLIPEGEHALAICRVMHEIEQATGINDASDMYASEILLRMGKRSEAAEAIERYTDYLIRRPMFNELLYSPGISPGSLEKDWTKDLRQLLLYALEHDEQSKAICETEAGSRALQKLKDGL